MGDAAVRDRRFSGIATGDEHARRVDDGTAADSDIAQLALLPTVSLAEPVSDWLDADRWTLTTGDGDAVDVTHKPRLLCRSVPAALNAVAAGAGIGLLPEHSCAAGLANGELVRMWPAWSRVSDNIGLLTTARRGMSPAVEALIDFLGTRLGSRTATARARPIGQARAAATARSRAYSAQTAPARGGGTPSRR